MRALAARRRRWRDRRCRRRCRRSRAGAACARSSNTAFWRADDRQRRSSARGRRAWPARRPRLPRAPALSRSRSARSASEACAFVRPDPRRSAAPAALRRIERQHAQQRVDASRSARSPTKVMLSDVAIVEHRGRFGDAALAAVGRGAFDHQRVRRDADGERPRRASTRGSRAANRSTDAPTVGMLRRIERPVAHRDQQRAGQLQQAPRQFGGQLGDLGHGVIISDILPAACERSTSSHRSATAARSRARRSGSSSTA